MSVPHTTLTATMEDYLEAIYSFTEGRGFARVGEIAKKLQVKSSSVNSALSYLCAKDLVVHEKYGYVGLTPTGIRLAAGVKSKHATVFRFLTEILFLEPADAEKEACGIEHAISKKTFLRLEQFLDFIVSGASEQRADFSQHFKRHIEAGKRQKSAAESE